MRQARRRALSVWLPNWPITRLKRAMGARLRIGAQGLATMAVVENAQRLAAVDETAAECGAFPGQAMTDALALLPQLTLIAAEPEADAEALSALASWCSRFSPLVAVDAPDGVLIDIEGCAHLWGGEEKLAEALRARLQKENVRARVGIADTFGAAWALARFGSRRIEIAGDDAQARLAAFPVAALRLSEDMCAQLRRLGLKTIGQIATLPRASLRKRFGAELLLRRGRALGEEDEPLDFLHPPAVFMERRVFAEPIARPEDMQRVVCDLAVSLCARLDEAGLGARRFEVAFHRVDGETAYSAVGMALPARDPKQLARLFTPKLDFIDPGFGVEVATLHADIVEPLVVAQSDLVAVTAEARNADLAPLVDRLRNRLGADRVWRAAPQVSHVPERALTHVAPLAAPTKRAWAPDRPRPVRLFQPPQPIEALAVAPDDPPFIFHWQGAAHRVRAAEGPERIAAEWWRKPWAEEEVDRVRDYYCVEDESGARFWLFRTGLYGAERPTRWWLHGLFA